MARNAGVLNFNEEPCTHWSDRDVYNALTSTPEKYLHWVHQSLEDIANGKDTHDTPSKQIFGDESGDFRSMPSIVYRGSSVSKIVKIIGTNNVQKIVKGKFRYRYI